MKATTMLDTLSSLLGTPVGAIPLSSCRIARQYLLDRASIGAGGTALLFCIPYVMTADVDDPARNLSHYALPQDYHTYAAILEKTVLSAMQTAFPNHRFALFADHSPILEVDAAARAGLGVCGKNGLLLTPQYGSFVFIMEVVTDADYRAVTGWDAPAFSDDVPLCDGCGACLRACPTQGQGCLSELTQKKGKLTTEELDRLSRHPLVWGCDTCQVVCPHNRRVIEAGVDTPIPFFREGRMGHMSSAILESMDDETFASRAYAWRGRAVIQRNVSLKEIAQIRNKEEGL